MCQAVQVVSQALSPMVMDDTYLYGFAGVSLVKIPKAGGAATTLAQVPTGVGGIFLDLATVYYSDSVNNGAKVTSIPKSGGTPHVYYDPGPVGSIFDVAFVGGWLYWIELGNGGPLGSGTYLRRLATFDSSSTATTVVASSSAGFLTPLQVAGNNLYMGWSDGTTTSIQWLSFGGTPTTFSAGASPVGMAADAQNLFWSNNGPALGLVSEPLGGGTTTSLPGGGATGISVDDQYVYGNYVTASTAYVFRTSKTGGTTQHMVDYPEAQWSGCRTCFANDATDVYWVQQDGVYRVAK
jgi:hypothetical protein